MAADSDTQYRPMNIPDASGIPAPRLRAGRGTNFRGIVREGGNIISIKRDGIRKLAARDLHAVTGISGEADHSLLDDLAFALTCGNFRKCGHRTLFDPRLVVTPDR